MNIGLGIGIPFTRSSLWASIFTPGALFLDGSTQGVWYDPSDDTTLFQDAAGTIPVTAVEQPVGLVLDKSKGLVLGPELVTNGDFSQGTTGWSGINGTDEVVSSGRLNFISAVATNPNASQPGIIGINKTYRVSITVSGRTAGGVFLVMYGTTPTTSATFTADGTYDFYMLSPVDATGLFGVRVSSSTTLSVDNISVRELPGNHAFNPSGNSANFPVLSARYNVLNNTETLATQSVTTRAAKYILSFWGTGSVALSGTYTGTLVGTGADNRVYVEFTATAGTLTLTVTGSVLKAQLEEL